MICVFVYIYIYIYIYIYGGVQLTADLHRGDVTQIRQHTKIILFAPGRAQILPCWMIFGNKRSKQGPHTNFVTTGGNAPLTVIYGTLGSAGDRHVGQPKWLGPKACLHHISNSRRLCAQWRVMGPA